MKNCFDEETLQAWFDGELPANEAASVSAHLNVCAACAATATAVEAESLTLREALGPEFAASVPSERLRDRVDSAIAALHQPEVSAVRVSRRNAFTHLFGSFRPLAYASVAAVLLVAAIICLAREQILSSFRNCQLFSENIQCQFRKGHFSFPARSLRIGDQNDRVVQVELIPLHADQFLIDAHAGLRDDSNCIAQIRGCVGFDS